MGNRPRFSARHIAMVVALIATSFFWLWPSTTDVVDTSAPASASAPHVYDDPGHAAQTTHTVPERGPPATSHSTTTYGANGDRSPDVSARPDGSTPAAAIRHIASSVAALTGLPTPTTGRHVVVADGDFSALPVASVAANGGASAVRVGQAGEAAVRSAHDIGPKATKVINGRTRIFDGLTDDAVSEVKNVKYQAFTRQLRDNVAYAQSTGRRFDLYVRGGSSPTSLSGPLQDAIRSGQINLRSIP